MSKKTLLIVDDEPGLVEMLQAGLEIEGYRVATALDGPTALRLVHAEQPALVILDIAMPGMTGWEVLDHIEANPETAGTPVVMLTALTADADAVRGLEMGALDYITKPFDFQHLVRVIGMISDKLDSRGQDQYRQQIIAQRKRLRRPLDKLFPSGSDQKKEGR